MAGTQPVRSIYQSVIDDVIGGVRDLFLEEGMDEQVLAELKQLWETKVMQSKSVEIAQPAPVQKAAPDPQSFAPHPAAHRTTTQQQNQSKLQYQQHQLPQQLSHPQQQLMSQLQQVPQQQQQLMSQQQQQQQQLPQQLISQQKQQLPQQLSQPQLLMTQQQVPQQQQQQLMSQQQQQQQQLLSQQHMIPVAHKPLPVPAHTGGPLPAHQHHNIQAHQPQQQQPVNLQQGAYSVAHQPLSNATQTAILSLPGGGMYQHHLPQAAGGQARFTLSNGQVMHLAPGQRVVSGGTVYTLGQQGGAPPTAAPPPQLSLEDLKPIGTNSQHLQQLDGVGDSKHLQQLDGVGDSSSDEEEEEDEDEDEPPEDVPGVEEEPLNSGDDVSDADPTEVFDAENVVVCQFDKINRCKNKWKFHLKDGIMNLNGRDYVFQKATGDAEW